MTCTSCGDKPKNSSKGFPRAVVEINNPESLVLLRKVVIPVSMGTEEDVPPVIGKYFNVLLQYEANGHIYLYSSDGIPTAIEANIPQEVLDRIEDLEIDVDVLETGLANETEAREAADSALSSSINSLSSSLSAETEAREQADAALEGSINNLTADLEEEATARETADTALGGRIDTVANNLATETANRISADEDLQADIVAEATARQNADTAINEAITAEASTRQTADAGLQSQIDAITASSDVKDIVGTKAELNNYDTSTLGNNDIIKVLQDESENNATTYYRWNATTQQFTLIGEEGPYYTKSQADTLLNAKQNTLTAGSNVQIVNDTISATDTTYTAGTGLALNGTQFSVDTTTVATQSDLTAGLATKQDTLTAGANIQINNNTISATDTTYTAGTNVSISSGNVISATDTTYSDFTGTDGTAAGTAGLVPAPGATDAGKFLKADGTWDTAGGSGPTVVQATGTSTTDVMSQNAVTSMVYADPSTKKQIQIGAKAYSQSGSGNSAVSIGAGAQGYGNRAIAIGGAGTGGSYSTATSQDAISIATNRGVASSPKSIFIGNYIQNSPGEAAIAIGSNTAASPAGSVALGAFASAAAQGEMNIGVSNASQAASYGYSGTQYRLLTGLYDPQSDHDAATKGYVDNSLLGKQDALTAGSGISITDESGSLVISATGGGGGGLDPNTTFWGQTASNGAVTGRITFGTNGYVNGTNSTVTVYADTAGGADPFEFSHTGLDVASKKITNLATPTANGDAATKGYVDTAVAGAGASAFTTNEWNALWA